MPSDDSSWRRSIRCTADPAHDQNDASPQALAPALRRWRAATAAATARGRAPPKPHLAAFDISRAFDGVPTARLLALAQRLLTRPAYTIVKFSEVLRSVI